MFRTFFSRRSPIGQITCCAGLLLLAASAPAATPPVITTFAGNLIPSGTATNIGIGASGVAVDPSGNVYFADSSNHTIRKLTPGTGLLTVVAGTGNSGFSGDGGPATSAQLNSPRGVARDTAGNLYIADTSNHRIRKIDATTGNISTIVGNGTGTFGGDNAAATAARVNSPQGVAVDAAGNLYIADTSNNRVRKVDAGTGNIATLAGNGTGGYLADNVAATGTRINQPRGVVVDSAGNVYIADTSNNRIRKVDTGGTITTFAGTGTASFSGDNGAATSATIRAPQAIALDASGNLYIADTTNHRVRKISGGIITTLSGTGSAGYGGDNGVATSGQLSSPAGIAVDASGNVYIGDTGNLRLRKLSGGNITTAAGTGSATYGGDGGTALNAQFTSPQQIVVDPAGNYYLSDSGTHRVRKMDTNGIVTTIAGTGIAGFSGDNGPATSAQLNTPLGIALDAAGNLYIADGNNNRIRKVAPNGTISTFAGDGTGSFGGDNGPASSAQVFGPFGVATLGSAVYITDTGNNRVRKVDAGGTITTIAGTGTAGFAGDGGAATSAQFNTPLGICPDAAGNLYITDYSNGSVRKIATNGIVTTVAGNGANGYGGDNGPATSAQLNSPRAVAVDAAGNLYITDGTNNRIRMVDTSGTITTIAGNGTGAFSGDGGPAVNAQVNNPQAITTIASGSTTIILFGDTSNRRFRRIGDTPPVVSSALTASATYGSPFSGYTITATSNTPTTFGATGLPPGLTLNSSTGVISGTPTQSGTFNVGLTGSNVAGAGQAATLVLTVAKAALTVTGAGARSKAYDGNTSVALDFSGASLSGVLGGDDVTLNTSGATGTFSDADAGTAKNVAVFGLALGGSAASNYTLATPTITAAIFPGSARITLSGLGHTYDGTAKQASVSVTPALGYFATYSPSPVIKAGTYTVFVSVTDANYGGSTSGTLTIAKAAQSLSISADSGKVGTTVNISATASSKLPVTLSVVSGGATLSGSTLTFTAPGPVVLRATQAGDDNHLAATLEKTVTAIGKLDQTIAFAPLADRPGNDPAFALAATATSGLPVSFSVSGPAMLNGGTLTLDGTPGPVTVTASQEGNAAFNAAPTATVRFNVAAAGPRVFVGSVMTAGGSTRAGDLGAVLPPTGGDGRFLLLAPHFNLNLAVDFTVGADGRFVQSVVDPGSSLQSIDGRPAAAAARTLTLRGELIGNLLSGRFDEIDLSFRVALQSRGATTPAAGFYHSSTLNSATGFTYTVVGHHGEVLALAATATTSVGGKTTLDGNGAFAVSTDGASLTGRIDPATTTITGTVSTPGQPAVEFAGLAVSAPRADRLVNLSSRVRVGAAGGRIVTGFVISGPQAIRVLLRAAGPALTGFGLTGALANPRLELYDATGQLVLQNDDWSGVDVATAATQAGAFALASGSRDAALLTTLQPGAYTMHVLGGGEAGLALAEIYAAGPTAPGESQRLVNLSSRGTVEAGDGVFIGGFVITGNAPKKVLIRGVGPALAAFDVTGVLADPKLAVYRGATLVAQNNDWSAPQPIGAAQVAATAADLTAAAQATGAFAYAENSRDAAILVTLAPGAYTAQVTASDGVSTGTALVEIYELRP